MCVLGMVVLTDGPGLFTERQRPTPLIHPFPVPEVRRTLRRVGSSSENHKTVVCLLV